MIVAKVLMPVALVAAVCCHHSVAGVGSAGTAPRGVVRASDYGFDPEDSTAVLKRALDSGATKVIIDRAVPLLSTEPAGVMR